MKYQENVKLAPYTTFHIGGPANFFCVASNADDVAEAMAWAKQQDIPFFILGGGSNILVSDNGFDGLVVHLENKGIEVVGEDDKSVILKISAGEVWDDVVKYAVEHNWWGIENLSHIPGNSGALAIQNVGAYGQEASEVIQTVQVFDTADSAIKMLSNSDCGFTYRHSILNTTDKGRYVVLTIDIKLSKTLQPILRYGQVSEYFAVRNITNPTQQEIRQAIIFIRDSKISPPNAPTSGTVGSFFRGPVLSFEQWDEMLQIVKTNLGAEAEASLRHKADDLKVAQGMKTPSGFLIELCGLKGRQVGGAQISPKHAAVIINITGQATARDVMDLFEKARAIVQEKTGVELHFEPEILGVI